LSINSKTRKIAKTKIQEEVLDFPAKSLHPAKSNEYAYKGS
jgi:hypothetical protein